MNKNFIQGVADSLRHIFLSAGLTFLVVSFAAYFVGLLTETPISGNMLVWPALFLLASIALAVNRPE